MYPRDALKLVYKGKILDDDAKPISEYGVDESGFLVVFSQKKAPAPAAAATAAAATPSAAPVAGAAATGEASAAAGAEVGVWRCTTAATSLDWRSSSSPPSTRVFLNTLNWSHHPPLSPSPHTHTHVARTRSQHHLQWTRMPQLRQQQRAPQTRRCQSLPTHTLPLQATCCQVGETAATADVALHCKGGGGGLVKHVSVCECVR